MNSIKTALRNIEWKISNVTRNTLKDGNSVSSSYFKIPADNLETQWYFNANIKYSKLGVYLYLCPQYPKIIGFSVEFEIYIYNIKNEKVKKHRSARECGSFSNGYGWASIISVAELFENSTKYIKNGTLTIGANIEIIRTATKEPDNKEVPTASRHQAIFRDYFNTKTLSDLKFVCSDMIKVPAHRFAIAASSPVWMNMIEAVPDMKKIEVDDIDSATMTEILRFIYTEEVNDIKNMAPKLIYGAHKYELNSLKEFCVASMVKNLSILTAVDYFLLADQLNNKELLESCINFIKINHQVMVRGKGWEKLDKKHLNELLSYYQQNPEYILTLESSFHNY